MRGLRIKVKDVIITVVIEGASKTFLDHCIICISGPSIIREFFVTEIRTIIVITVIIVGVSKNGSLNLNCSKKRSYFSK